MDIQTAQGATIMSTTRSCLKTYYVRDRLGEIRPIDVKAYVVPGLKYHILSVKGLNKCGYDVFHHPDPEEYVVYAVIKKKTYNDNCVSGLESLCLKVYCTRHRDR